MAKFRLDSIATLARQLEFTPGETRLAQVAAAEDLLHDLTPDRAYPLDFVIFRITGYRPKSNGRDLLTGLALQHDLGLLIERVSDSLDIRTRSLAEPVLSIEDVTERFNVTSKTIQRWRRRGLPGRKFLFPDGKRRVGFLLSSVERFLARHGEQVARGMNFSQVSEQQRQEILRRARRLASHCHCCANEIARRIGRRMGRSPLTILHTIRKHDQENPQQAIFTDAPRPLTDQQRARVVRAYRRGMSVRSLARRLCLPRAAIYRAILDERIHKLTQRKIRFIDDPLYHHDDAEATINAIAAQEALGEAQRPEDLRIPRDLPPYLQDLYRTPLLTASRERALFLKFNFHKFQFVQARRRLEPQFARARDLNEMERLLRSATATKNRIVQANLRLVVSVARRHLRPGLSLMELISDGNITLMRAVESFDIHKGNRFSTYATLALMKGFARSVPLMLGGGGASLAHEEMLQQLPDSRGGREHQALVSRDEVRQLLSRLDERERRVLRAHWGLSEAEPTTLEQLGHEMGLSKQRVRQIERTAMAKLRAMG